MLVCTVSSRARRSPDAALAEVGAALDVVNALRGLLVSEAANAAAVVSAGLAATAAVIETAGAADSSSATIVVPSIIAAMVAESTAADTVQDAVISGIPITGLIGWWDASVTASLSLTGSTVNSIADQSGNGKTLSQVPTARNLPTYSATGLNSRPAIMFAGASLQMIGNDSFSLTGSTMTSFCVCDMSSTAPANARLFNYVGSGQTRDWNNQVSFAFGRDVSNAGVKYTRASVDFITTMTMNAPHRVIVTTNAAGVKSIYIDGVATTVTGTGYAFTAPGTYGLGSTKYTPDDGASLTGAIAEAGISTNYSDATSAASLDTYLKNKWGL